MFNSYDEKMTIYTDKEMKFMVMSVIRVTKEKPQRFKKYMQKYAKNTNKKYKTAKFT